VRFTQGISIDGTYYDVGIVSMKRTFDVLDKFAERDEENGDLHREVLGIYQNYALTFGTDSLSGAEYDALVDKLTEPVEYHNFKMPTTVGTFDFRGYISKVSDEADEISENSVRYKSLTCQFTMKKPYRTP
jgi:hypothetical protein